MTPVEPRALVETLDPPEGAIIKRERRTIVWRETRADGTPTVVKLYRERSVGDRVNGAILRYRAEREYRRLAHLVRWGIPCTEPLAWGAGVSPEHGRHEVLVTREVPDAVELGDWLRGSRRGKGGSGNSRASGPVRDLDLAPLFRVVREMHESGLVHQTLYGRNVLVSTTAAPGEEFFLLDVPRSWTFPGSVVGTSMAGWDLYDLWTELEEAGAELGEELLDEYGLDARGRRWWAGRRAAGVDPRAKRNRLKRDGIARLRWAAGWGVGWMRRAAPPSLGEERQRGVNR